MDEQIKKLWYVCDEILLSYKKEWCLSICGSMDGIKKKTHTQTIDTERKIRGSQRQEAGAGEMGEWDHKV